jgi:N-acetylmuramoyl-L-alanine amidase
MARAHACSLLATGAVLVLVGGCTAPASAQNRTDTGSTVAPPVAPAVTAEAPPAAPKAAPVATQPPTAATSRLWPFKHLYNVDYIDVQDIAGRYGLKAAWVTSGRVMQLVDEHGHARLKFEDRNRDFYLDGVRVFMGETTIFNKGSLYVSKIDVIKTIAPLLRPVDHVNQLPGPPKLIVLDAGHGGSDPGKQNLTLRLNEKDMTLDVVLRLRTLLEARGYRVLLTRGDDSKLAPAQRTDLERRADVANRAQADLFLSVHFNSAQPTVRGTETYVLTPQFQRSSADDKKDDSTNKLLPGNRQDFANVVLGYHLHRTLLADLKTSDRGYKRGRLLVLCFAECPAALVEVAYLSNDAETRKVATPEYRQQIAQAIADGVDDYAAALAALHPAASFSAETHAPAAASK